MRTQTARRPDDGDGTKVPCCDVNAPVVPSCQNLPPVEWASIDPSQKSTGVCLWIGLSPISTWVVRPATLADGAKRGECKRLAMAIGRPGNRGPDTPLAIWRWLLQGSAMVFEGAPKYTRGAKGAITMGRIRGRLEAYAEAAGIPRESQHEVDVEAWRSVLGYPASRAGRAALKDYGRRLLAAWAAGSQSRRWLRHAGEDEAEATLIGVAWAVQRGWMDAPVAP